MAHVEFRDQFGTFGKILIVQNHQINNLSENNYQVHKNVKKKLTINGRHIKTLKTNWSVQQAKWRCSFFININ